jgi:hypothetical protein
LRLATSWLNTPKNKPNTSSISTCRACVHFRDCGH